MKQLVIACALLLSVVGCTSTEPTAERDEAAYVNLVRGFAEEGASIHTDEELIAQGDEICEIAASGDSTMEELDELATSMGEANQTEAAQFVAVITRSAGAALCPEL